MSNVVVVGAGLAGLAAARRLVALGHEVTVVEARERARDLAIGEQTIKTHVRSILTKLGLQDRVQAAIFALRHQAGSHQVGSHEADSCEPRPG